MHERIKCGKIEKKRSIVGWEFVYLKNADSKRD